MDWDLLSFVLSSEKREKIIKSLEHPTTPTKISKETGVTKAHVTRILKRFEELKLVVCKTPDKRKGKIYLLTDKGMEILSKLNENRP